MAIWDRKVSVKFSSICNEMVNVRSYCFLSQEVSPDRISAELQLLPNPSQHRRRTTLFGAFIPFHSNPSWSLKNSRKAGSSSKDARSFGVCSSSTIETIDLRLSAADERPDRERHICAKRPSSCRRPFLILTPSKEER